MSWAHNSSMRVVGGREMTTPLVFPPSATCLWYVKGGRYYLEASWPHLSSFRDDRPAGVRVETCVDGQRSVKVLFFTRFGDCQILTQLGVCEVVTVRLAASCES